MRKINRGVFGSFILFGAIVLLSYLFAPEIIGLVILLSVGIAGLYNMREWRYMKNGIEYFIIDGNEIRLKKFSLVSNEEILRISELKNLSISNGQICFRVKSRKYELRQSALIEGNWQKLVDRLKDEQPDL